MQRIKIISAKSHICQNSVFRPCNQNCSDTITHQGGNNTMVHKSKLRILRQTMISEMDY